MSSRLSRADAYQRTGCSAAGLREPGFWVSYVAKESMPSRGFMGGSGPRSSHYGEYTKYGPIAVQFTICIMQIGYERLPTTALLLSTTWDVLATLLFFHREG